MPGKLKVLVGLLAFSILLNLGSQAWLSAIINVALVAGVFKGSEGTRSLMIGLAWLGLVLSIGLAAFSGFVVAQLVGQGELAAGAMMGIVGLFVALFGAGQNGYFLWCLRQQDVQHWMYQRSMGIEGEV